MHKSGVQITDRASEGRKEGKSVVILTFTDGQTGKSAPDSALARSLPRSLKGARGHPLSSHHIIFLSRRPSRPSALPSLPHPRLTGGRNIARAAGCVAARKWAAAAGGSKCRVKARPIFTMGHLREGNNHVMIMQRVIHAILDELDSSSEILAE